MSRVKPECIGCERAYGRTKNCFEQVYVSIGGKSAAARRNGAAGSGTPLCSTNTMRKRINPPYETRNSFTWLIAASSASAALAWLLPGLSPDRLVRHRTLHCLVKTAYAQAESQAVELPPQSGRRLQF